MRKNKNKNEMNMNECVTEYQTTLHCTALHSTVQYSRALTIWPILFSYQSINNVYFLFLHLFMQEDKKEIKLPSK